MENKVSHSLTRAAPLSDVIKNMTYLECGRCHQLQAIPVRSLSCAKATRTPNHQVHSLTLLWHGYKSRHSTTYRSNVYPPPPNASQLIFDPPSIHLSSRGHTTIGYPPDPRPRPSIRSCSCTASTRTSTRLWRKPCSGRRESSPSPSWSR